jgi:hypothetical protein
LNTRLRSESEPNIETWLTERIGPKVLECGAVAAFSAVGWHTVTDLILSSATLVSQSRDESQSSVVTAERLHLPPPLPRVTTRITQPHTAAAWMQRLRTHTVPMYLTTPQCC